MQDYWNTYFKQEKIEEKMKLKFSELVNDFKEEVSNHAKKVIEEFEIELLPYLFEDTSDNLRNALMECMKSDSAKKIRQQIFDENKDEIINGEIEKLKKDVEHWKNLNLYF